MKTGISYILKRTQNTTEIITKIKRFEEDKGRGEICQDKGNTS